MDKFELFCMIFLALDADWEDTHNEELGQFLSSINPYLFKEITSAVPSYYKNFERMIGDGVITIENSFAIAKDYIQDMNIPAVTDSWGALTEEQWVEACKLFLSTEHKGQDG